MFLFFVLFSYLLFHIFILLLSDLFNSFLHLFNRIVHILFYVDIILIYYFIISLGHLILLAHLLVLVVVHIFCKILQGFFIIYHVGWTEVAANLWFKDFLLCLYFLNLFAIDNFGRGGEAWLLWLTLNYGLLLYLGGLCDWDLWLWLVKTIRPLLNFLSCWKCARLWVWWPCTGILFSCQLIWLFSYYAWLITTSWPCKSFLLTCSISFFTHCLHLVITCWPCLSSLLTCGIFNFIHWTS